MNNSGKALKAVEAISENAAGVTVFILMIFGVLQVVSRYILKFDVIPGLFNIIESYVFPTSVFLALAGSYRIGLWPKLDILLGKMSPANRARVELLSHSIEFVLYGTVMVFTAIYAYKMTLETRQMQAGATNLPLYPILWIVPFAFILLVIRAGDRIWQNIFSLRK